MARDAAGNFYVADFWGKGIVKLSRQGSRIGFIATNGRPSAVAVLPDNRLVVAVATPQPKIAFYKQFGASPSSGEEDTVNVFGTTGTVDYPYTALYRPVAITVDAAGKIYVLDAGDNSGDKDGYGAIVTAASIYRGNVKVYSAAGGFLHEFGERTYPSQTLGTPGYFKLPQGIAYEKQANQIVVADTQNGRLQFFSASNGTSCTYDKSVGYTAGLSSPQPGSSVSFYNPVDVAFEYNDSAVLQRMYVAEKGKNQISVVDPATGFYLMGISDTYPSASGETMKLPVSILFERRGTGASTAGLVYTANAATSKAANILALGVDGGTVPVLATLTITTAVPPTVTATPLSGGLSGTVSIAANPVSCSVNGGVFVSATVTGNNWNLGNSGNANEIGLVTGDNYILCKTTSGATTTYAEVSTFYTGSTAPAPIIAILQPVASFYTKDATVVVSGTTKNSSNAPVANATVKLANVLDSSTVSTQSDANGNWTAVVSLAEGSNLVNVSSWKPGTLIGSASVTIVADYQDPVIAGVSFLSNNATTNLAVQNIDGVVQEANLSKIEVNGTIVPASAKITLGGVNTYFSVPVTLIRGSNIVTVTATDLAGRVSTAATRTGVILNPEAPGFTVALPADNSYLKIVDSAAPANGTAESGLTSVNGNNVSAGLWSATYNAQAGFNEYQFIATGGNTISAKRSVTVNTVTPYENLAITNPPVDKAVITLALIEGVVTPGFNPYPQISIYNGATLVVGPVEVTPAGDYASTGKFSYTVPSLPVGTNVVIVSAGNTTTVRNIIRDTTLPELTLQADLKAMPSIITGVIEPSAKISAITATIGSSPAVPVVIPLSVISFDAYDSATDSVTWHANLAGYSYDAISFTTIDPAGNEKNLPYDKGIPTGDIDEDGVVRLSDALAALRHVAGTQSLSVPQFKQADVGSLVGGRAGRDGVVDINDAVLILKKAYGLMTF